MNVSISDHIIKSCKHKLDIFAVIIATSTVFTNTYTVSCTNRKIRFQIENVIMFFSCQYCASGVQLCPIRFNSPVMNIDDDPFEARCFIRSCKYSNNCKLK